MKVHTYSFGGLEIRVCYHRDAEGALKWAVSSPMFDVCEYTDELWATKGEAVGAGMYAAKRLTEES